MRALSTQERLQLETSLYQRSFAHFVQAFWSDVDPMPLQWSLAMTAICTCLQAVSDGKIRKLIISVPPGCAKSLLTSVHWQGFQWARDPSWAMLSCSASLALTYRDSRRFSDLISSDHYRKHFGNVFQMDQDANALEYRKNNKGGDRKTVSVGNGTGFRATAQVIDDPLTSDDARSEAKRTAAKYWVNEALSNRYRDQSKAIRVVIAQRLHTDDVSGFLLATGEYQHLCLPSEFDPEHRCVVKDIDGNTIFEDPRTIPGELLTRFGFGEAENAQAKKDLGVYGYAAQQNQAPVPIGGGILRREWFTARHSPYLTPGAIATPTKFSKIGIIVDAAFKGGPTNDKVAMLVAGLDKGRIYCLDMVWDNLDFIKTVAAIKRLVEKWKATEVCIEDKANGPAIINQLREQMGHGIPIIPIPANDSKEARISAVSPIIEGGAIVLPISWQSTSRTVEDFIQEVTSFPFAANDDAADALAHTVTRFLSSGPSAHAVLQGWANAVKHM